MCNLNVFIKAKESEEEELNRITNFLICATTYSYHYNDDGDGYYFDSGDFLVKSPHKIDLLQFEEYIKKSNFIISHQRIATSGRTAEFIHPFSNDDFVLIHNGVMSQFDLDDGNSDTYTFFNLFYELFKSSEKENREDKIIESINNLLCDRRGTFSIFIYDKKEKLSYYFKGYGSRITILKDKEEKFMYITTEGDNKNFLKVYLDNGWEEQTISAYEIYRISLKDGKVSMELAGKIEEEEPPKKEEFATGKVHKKKMSKKEKKRLRKLKKREGWEFSGIKSPCQSCGIPTFNINRERERTMEGIYNCVLCDDCIKDEREVINSYINIDDYEDDFI